MVTAPAVAAGKNEHAGGGCSRNTARMSATHHAGHVVGVVAVLSRNNLVLRGDEAASRRRRVVPLVHKLLHMAQRILPGGVIADFVSAGVAEHISFTRRRFRVGGYPLGL